jgi:quinol monooxygenase YgiN
MSYVLLVELRVKPGNVEAFTQEVLANAAAARSDEPGCRHFDVIADPQDPARMMLYEVYDDERAFEAHQQTPHFKRYLAEAVPLLESRQRHVWKLVGPFVHLGHSQPKTQALTRP